MIKVIEKFDIIVIGAGHAGAEAAAAAANMGSKVLLITMDLTKIGQMSCNPAMGGIAKGQIIREIDALGGLSAYVTDKTMIQFRMLNKSKGPAMWSPRAQSDRILFSIEWRKRLENIPNLFFWQDTVKELILKDNVVNGVITNFGAVFHSKCVVLTAGTFLNGLMHVGNTRVIGGRAGESSSVFLSDQIKRIGVPTLRMKTGTPVRIDGRTIDFSLMDEQKGDENPGSFSFDPASQMVLNPMSCFMVYTNKDAHNELKKGFKFSPLFNGTIKGVGPRYCPSIEDKLITFSSKDSHLLFLEPDGVNSNEYYLNGFSSSLPLDVQLNALHKIHGLEKSKVFRPGYAIEYDYFDPTFLNNTLESKIIRNLFMAGQINGTTGYEEAAGQGLIAGINASLKVQDLKEFTLNRDEAYIGVLIDDLITKGVDEPYRMFTSRAEHRILLRQDNADSRLSNYGHKINLLPKTRHDLYLKKERFISLLIDDLSKTSIKPDSINHLLLSKQSQTINQTVRADKLILRPELSVHDFIPFSKTLEQFVNSQELQINEIIEAVEIKLKYQNYIDREKLIAEKLTRLENIKLPQDLEYDSINSISTEAKQKLNRIKPTNIAQASRIPGVSPSDINTLLIFMGR